MSGLTATAESDVISELLFSGSGTAYLALHTADPGNSPDGTTEVTAQGYSRLEISESNFTESGDEPTTLTNDNQLEFDAFEEDVGDITHGTIVDSATGGTYQAVGDVSPVKNFTAGDVARYDANAVEFTIQ